MVCPFILFSIIEMNNFRLYFDIIQCRTLILLLMYWIPKPEQSTLSNGKESFSDVDSIIVHVPQECPERLWEWRLFFPVKFADVSLKIYIYFLICRNCRHYSCSAFYWPLSLSTNDVLIQFNFPRHHRLRCACLPSKRQEDFIFTFHSSDKPLVEILYIQLLSDVSSSPTV